MRTPITTEQLTARDQILETARALVAGNQDVIRAATRIAQFAYLIDPGYEDLDLRTFVGISSETDRLVVLDSVHGWHPDVRATREVEYQEANEFYRERATRAAQALVRKLAPPA